MKVKNIAMTFLLIGAITFVVSLVVSYLYSLIAHGAGVWDLAHSIRMAIILGIVLSWMETRSKTK